MSFLRKKIKCQRYFDESSQTVDLPSIKAAIEPLDKKGEAKIAIGKIESKSKMTIPEHVSSDFIRLDQLQYTIANTINGIKHKDEQEKKKEEFLSILIQMLKLMTTPLDDQKSNSLLSPSKQKQLTGSSESNKDLKKYLDDRKFKSHYLPDNITADAGYIIWPVALQPSATYIHNAQIQLIKLFVLEGWKLHIIIGDCGKHAQKRTLPHSFKVTINDKIKKNGIPIEEDTIALLSEYYKRSSDTNIRLVKGVTSAKLLDTFHSISEDLHWNIFRDIIKKNYDENKQEEIEGRSVLHNLQPLLMCALVATIVEENEENKPKAIIIAGEDEEALWGHIAHDLSHNKMGVVYIHELKNTDGTTMDQEEIHIRSQEEMLTKLDVGNVAEWLYTHFVELPKFIDGDKPEFCKVTEAECLEYDNNCLKCLFTEGSNFNNENFNKEQFVESIYPLANPAN